MADFDYDSLKDKYGRFQFPRAVIKVNNKDIAEQKESLRISNIVVENSCGYEASQASFQVFGVFDENLGYFENHEISKYFKLGFPVTIAMGYSKNARTVFVGYIAQMNYIHKRNSIPGVIITCLDVKGAMMAGSYCKQIVGADCYSEALKKLMQNYNDLKSSKIITNVKIFDSPDKPAQKQQDESAFTVEMVEESDYEFAMKAAKKFNYEFFVSAGEVVYRYARSNEEILMDMDITQGFLDVDVEYSHLGQLASVEVRGIDAGKGEIIKAQVKSKSSNLINKKAEKVVIDPTIRDEEEAKYRAEYLMHENMYKFGVLRGTLVGLPEITPGRFITLKGLDSKGQKAKFYIQKVVQSMDGSDTYTTHLVAKAMDDKLSK